MSRKLSVVASPDPAPPGRLSVHDRVRLRAESFVAEETIERFLRGECVREATRMRIRQAATRLGIALPVVAEPANKAAASG